MHSKVLAVDDEFLTVGSANLSERSMRLDTECNVALEARGDPRIAQAIADLRARLLGEHLDLPPEVVAPRPRAPAACTGSSRRTRCTGRRTLAATEPTLDPTVDAITPDHGVLDPEQPLDPDVLVADLLPEPEPKHRVHGRLIGIIALVAALAGARARVALHAAARVAQLRHARRLRGPLGILAGGAARGDRGLRRGRPPGGAGDAADRGHRRGVRSGRRHALRARRRARERARSPTRSAAGSGRDTVRRLAGRRLNALSQRLGKRGVLAILLVRLLPVAPFSIVNLVAGASHIGWRDFLLGTALGLAPGVVMATVFVDRAIEAIRHPGPVTYLVLCLIAAAIVAAGFAARRWLRPAGDPPAADRPRGAKDAP